MAAEVADVVGLAEVAEVWDAAEVVDEAVAAEVAAVAEVAVVSKVSVVVITLKYGLSAAHLSEGSQPLYSAPLSRCGTPAPAGPDAFTTFTCVPMGQLS